MATSKYETRGIVGELDPKYDAEAWDNDEGSYKVQIKNPTGDTRLDNLARSAAHKALHQDGMNGAKTDMMVKGSDGKNYQILLLLFTSVNSGGYGTWRIDPGR